MLTKNDLKQIGDQTRQIVKEETPKVIQKEVKSVKEDLQVVKKEIKTMKEDMVKIRKDMDVVISLFDRDYIELRKRVERIEEHIGFVA